MQRSYSHSELEVRHRNLNANILLGIWKIKLQYYDV